MLPAPAAIARPAPAASRPSLVVLLVVDQLPSWTFSRHLQSFRGGFARLAREGVYWPHAAYPYAATITAIGHAALATGAEPHRSGIVGNSWWDSSGRWMDTTEDRAHPTVPAQAGDDGASPQWRLVEAVGAGRKVLSLSNKERAAILMAPSKGAAVAWYEPQQSAFVTSTTYAASQPAWLETLAREHPVTSRLDYVWTPLEDTPKRALVGDAAPGELGKFGLGVSFPHRIGATKKPAFAVGSTPLASELLLEAALAGLDAVHPELLDISFSTHDFAAHAWGQESWEATDVLFRMDETIGKLFDALDARHGKDGWSLVFSSDHGGPRMPEQVKDALRVNVADLRKIVATAAGGAKWIAAMDERMIYLSPTARALPEDARVNMLDNIASALKRVPGVGFAFRTDAFQTNAECTGLPSELEMLVCRSTYGERSGDVYYGPRERSIVAKEPSEAVLHGTPYDYDRQVPIVVREPGRAPRVIDDETPSVLRVAPTIARLLAAAPPPAAREPSL